MQNNQCSDDANANGDQIGECQVQQQECLANADSVQEPVEENEDEDPNAGQGQEDPNAGQGQEDPNAGQEADPNAGADQNQDPQQDDNQEADQAGNDVAQDLENAIEQRKRKFDQLKGIIATLLRLLQQVFNAKFGN